MGEGSAIDGMPNTARASTSKKMPPLEESQKFRPSLCPTSEKLLNQDYVAKPVAERLYALHG